jgi:hypothetical protein|tara:strand:+ start:472 stop:687 length:216 start_codon:yes stop_codon:yes gene_type:complete
MNTPKNYRNPQSFRNVAQQAQKYSEMAYLEACQPKHLQNRVLMDCYFKEAKRLTNRLKNAGYWKNSVISVG